MASTWAARLPVVTVPETDTAKPVTIVLPYYEAPVFLRRQIGWWASLPASLRPWLRVIVVDDGSPESPAENVLARAPAPFPIRLFRIDPDVPWNWLAARNIGMSVAESEWCVLTDMDHVVPASTAAALVYGRHDPRVIYAFSRIEHSGEGIPPHSASFFLRRSLFWEIGGYDETLSGHYGTDGDWRRRCAAVAPIQVLADRLIRHEYQDDASVSRYRRKLPEDAEAVRRLVAARPSGWTPKTLSFPYHEVELCCLS